MFRNGSPVFTLAGIAAAIDALIDESQTLTLSTATARFGSSIGILDLLFGRYTHGAGQNHFCREPFVLAILVEAARMHGSIVAAAAARVVSWLFEKRTPLDFWLQERSLRDHLLHHASRLLMQCEDYTIFRPMSKVFLETQSLGEDSDAYVCIYYRDCICAYSRALDHDDFMLVDCIFKDGLGCLLGNRFPKYCYGLVAAVVVAAVSVAAVAAAAAAAVKQSLRL